MPFIQNCSWDDAKNGWHKDPGENSILIQIADPASFFPTPKHPFAITHQFEFLDVEDKDGFPDEVKIQPEQAMEITNILYYALEFDMNVIVHCFAGICRSGAVAEVGVMMGFDDTEKYRQPNIRVKTMLMRQLGWTYD